jgi:drug/metabolite transporter (DMT)-like permease
VPPLAGLAVAVVAVSTSAILVRYSDAPSTVKALYRVAFTVLLLAPVAVTRSRASFARLRRRDAVAAGLAGVALAVHFAAWFRAIELTSIAASVTLVQAHPLFVAVGAWALLGERVTRRTVLGIVVTVLGMAGMSAGDLLGGAAGPAPLVGDALAVTGAVAAAGYFLAGRSIRQRVPLVPYVVVVYAACTLALLALALAEGLPLLGYPRREWLLFLAMAVGPGLFGHTVLNWALGHLQSSVVSASLLGEPVGASLLALVLLGEVPTLATVGGGAVVLVGIAVTARAREAPDADADADAGSPAPVDADPGSGSGSGSGADAGATPTAVDAVDADRDPDADG